jgi:2-oxoisovalerate dehydrogenase E1 component alpha subunit
LIEAITYRMGGHSTSDDPKAYRGSDEVEPWAARDPLERVRDYLTRKGLWDAARQSALVEEIDTRFRDAVSIAERTPAPPLESMFEDVYATAPWHLVEQRQQLLSGPRAPSAH